MTRILCHDREFSVVTDLDSDKKKKYPWDLGHHSLVSKTRFINT